LAVCTNKLEGLSRSLFAELGLLSRFAAVVGGDTLPVKKPDGSYDTLYLDSGKNPPNGVVVNYWLPERPGAVSLAFLDERGRELRRYAAAPARAGMNSFLWNRRLPGVANVLAKDLEPWNRGDGPMVVPGKYAVALTVDGKTETQAFEILRDPRVRTKLADLKAQFVFLKEILERLGAVNATINAVDAVRAQMAILLQRAAGKDALLAEAKAVAAEIDAIRGLLIDVHYSGAQLWGSGLHEKFNALFDTVDSGDFAPARQTREVFAALSGQLDGLTARWRKVEETRLPSLARSMADAGLPAIG